MQNIFDVYFYGLRAQGRYSPYVGRDLTNQELLNGFTENIQYGGGQNHTSGGISLLIFLLDPFVLDKFLITLNDFVDQVKRITTESNFGSKYYAPSADVYATSKAEDLPMWRSMTTDRGRGSYVGIQTDPSKYSIFYNWTGQTFSNKWDPTIIDPRVGDQVVDKLQIGEAQKFSREYENLLHDYLNKLLKLKYDTPANVPSWKLAWDQLNKQNHLIYDNVKNLKDNLQNYGIAALSGTGIFAYNNPSEKYLQYTLTQNIPMNS